MGLMINPQDPDNPCFVGVASGIDLSKPLDEKTIQAIDDGMTKYAVLVFRNQPLTQDEQIDFSVQFGPLDSGLRKATGAPTRFKHEQLIDIGNIALDGSIASKDNKKLIGVLANQLWHSDSSFQDLPVKYSMLSAVVVPDEGGQTQWADLRAAWDDLPLKTKQYIENKTGMHSAFHSRILLGDNDYTQEQLAKFPPVKRPLVFTHPDSGRKVLFPSVHISEVQGMTIPEGRLLIAELLEHATQPKYVYTHDWRPGDYVIWDNRSTLHRGTRYDLTIRRDLRRTTTLEKSANSQPVELLIKD
jgi:alpha-ketoglutarate-dependent 2,4-dichlorophenoxyacetate dioxygenase